MGQCTSHNSIVEQGATARMSPTAKTLRAEKNKRRFFRWSFSRKSKKTTNEAQQSRPAQRGSDGEAEQKSNTQSISKSSVAAVEDVHEDTHGSNDIVPSVDKTEENNNSAHSRVSSLKALEDVSEDVPKAEENSGTYHTSEDIWHSHVSSLKALEDVSEDVPKAEENSGTDHTSEDIWHSRASSLKALEDVSEDVPKAEENSGTDHTSEDIWHSCLSSLNISQYVDVPRQEQGSISTNSRTSKSVSSVTEEKNCTPLRSDDVPWENEDEKIHLSLKANTGNINQHYEVGEMLGKGAFGNVFEATRLSDSRKVALKYVVKKKNMRTVRVGGLLGKSLPAEVALMILMNKGPRVPEIINLLDWYETPREYIMVLERPMPCTDLWHFLLTHGGKISEWQARVVMRQVVTAANICCERGVFHSDIKLQNLLINPNTLQVKLIDFGCGRRLKSSAYSRFGGTEVYMSPEMNKRRYHAKPSTVFSLGILLFKMLFGRFPQELTFKTILENLTEVSKECSELIALCVEMNPSERINLEKILLHDWFQGSIREAARETDE